MTEATLSDNAFKITDSVISVFAAAGGALSFVNPKRRAFSLVDLNISFPFGEFPRHNARLKCHNVKS